MSDEQIKKVKKDYQNGAQKIDTICDMALRTHDAEQQRDKARQEAARLREALWTLDGHARLYMTLSDNVDRQVRAALQSAPPASEPSTEALGREAYPQAYSPAPADRAPREGDKDGPVPTRRPSADRADRAESERDEARQEAARLRAALQAISENSGALREGGADPMDLGDLEDALTDAVDRAVTALQSAPPASEPECGDGGPCKYGCVGDNCVVRQEGDYAPSAPADRPEPMKGEKVQGICLAYDKGLCLGADGRDLPNPYPPASDEAWAFQYGYSHGIKMPKSPDRPEPSEALAFEQWWQEQVGDSDSWTTLERLAAKDAWDAALSQPAPAVPDAVRRLPEEWRNSAEMLKRNGWPSADARHFQLHECSYELERALATHPADGDSPAVPPWIAKRVIAARDAFLEGDDSETWHQLYGIADPTYTKPPNPWSDLERIAAAPTPTDDGEK